MRIKIVSGTVKNFVFEMSGDGKLGTATVAQSFNTVIEDLPYIRATGIDTVSRGNSTVDIAVSIWRSFSSAVDAALFCLDIRDSVPETGRVELTTIDGSGAKGTRFINSASVPSIETRQEGKSAQITFHIHGGKVTKT